MVVVLRWIDPNKLSEFARLLLAAVLK